MQKRTKTILKTLMWVVLTPILLVLLLFVCLYIPPIQKWAVDTAADCLSEEMGMQVSVDRVLLKFPLDLSVGGVLAVKPADGVNTQQPDTVLDAEELLLDVALMPLFKGEVMVENATLKNTKVNTLDLVEALQIKGHVGELQSNDISFGLNSGEGIIPTLSLKDSELSIILADSVLEDTTEEEEGFLKTIDMQGIKLENVALNLDLAPSADSMFVATNFPEASLSAFLDLENGNYYVKDLKASDSKVNYDIGKGEALPGFDPNHINLSNLNLQIDSLSYLANGDLYVGINQLAGKDRGGLKINDAKGAFRMDAKRLYLDNFSLKTDETDLDLTMAMDMNAFDETDPGVFEIDVNGIVGKDDISQFTSDFTPQFMKGWPNKPLTIDMKANGNMQTLYVDHIKAKMDGAFDINGSGVMTDLMDPNGNIGMDLDMNMAGQDLAFIKQFLPADVASSFNIPRGTTLNGKMSMKNGRLLADAILSSGRSSAKLKADYNMNSEAYEIDLHAKNFDVNRFVPLGEPCSFTGHLYAKGQGFDFDNPRTYCKANANIDDASYSTYYLTNTSLDASLLKQTINADMKFDDPRLQGHFIVDGKMTAKNLDADAQIDLPFSDIQALGFSPDPLTAHATHGTLHATSNFDNLFLVDADVEGVQVILNEDSIVTDKFDLFAETTLDRTDAVLHTGDLDFEFNSPKNLFALIDDFTKVGETVQQQLEDRELSFDAIKAIMPEARLKANIGHNNPVSKFLSMQGYNYDEVVANLRTSQEYGLQGDAHVFAFKTDSMKVDTILFNIEQDSTHLRFDAALACNEQQDLVPAFTAHLDGYVSPSTANVRLNYFDGEGKKGVDLGLDGIIGADSILHMKMYPEEPIIAYRKFKVNDDNYLDLHKHNRLFADLELQSTTDSCYVGIFANPADSMNQQINAIIKQLNIEELLTVLPFVPKMKGVLGLDATYSQNDENFNVEGMLSADDFYYEGTPLGDVVSMFKYQPMGEAGHDIHAILYQNGNNIMTAQGTYNVVGPDYLDMKLLLDNLPMSIASAFVPDQICAFSGNLDGIIDVHGPADTLLVNGNLYPNDIHVYSDVYSFDLTIGNDPITFTDSRIQFNQIKILGSGGNPLTVNGYVDFSNFDDINMSLSVYGQNFEVFNAPRTRKSALFGKLYGDFFARVTGSTNDLRIRGLVNVLSKSDITYIMTNTPLTVDYRLDDIVTFVDFSAPPESSERIPHTFVGIDMDVTLEVEDGAKINCEFSADKQSYVTVQGGGSIDASYTPEGVLSLQGRYTINEGEMKYTLPVIPLKTFTLKKGSYIEFTGEPANPTLNIAATEQTKAGVSNADGSSRSVLFNVGLKITNTLNNMGLEFTIEAPEDIAVQNELAGMTAEEKNKLAVALLATGMYLSSSNTTGFSATNALNNFLQSEINNIAGKAISTAVDVDMSVGMEQTKRDDGTTRTDYSFKFTKRFFSDKLNVVIGGRINADGNNGHSENSAYIDDISLEWRLDDGGTQYVRLFHDKNYDNIVEGELTENGAGIVLRKKLDSISELFIFKRKNKEEQQPVFTPGLRQRTQTETNENK
ncbi:MAG: translocation/assembly module TamB [Bacteroidaceae bacterium]|nr:translocation/assembly module TamB [Bacteroidaceae bacterium]